MPLRRAAVVAVVLLAACTSEAVTTTTEADPPTTEATTSTSTSTTTTSTTTTTIATTTTSDPFFLVEPSKDDRESYALLALLALNETAFSSEEIGSDRFVEMLVFGAQTACIRLSEEETLVSAIEGAIESSPVYAIPPEDWTAEQSSAAFVAAFHIVSSGTPLYCPSIAPELSPESDRAAEEFTSAWQVFLGGEPLDTEGWIRDGTWQVGVDIEPGTYRNSGSDGCYWERLSGFSGESDDLIANGFPNGDTAIVTIQPTDVGFLSEDCGRWIPTDE